MRDLFIVGFMLALLTLGLKRPFLFTLAYIYVDTVSPHRISYYLINSLPLSMIVAVMAIGGWLLLDGKKGSRLTARQGLIGVLLIYCWWTTQHAAVPLEAQEKWDWVWKTLFFAMFLPLTLRTRLRVEACLLFCTLSAAVIIIAGGIKTAAGGGGYGQLSLLVSSNSGLYEGSTISAIAIALIPVILWFSRHGTIFPRDWRVRTFCGALVFACLLMPVGTEARTGLICVAVLALLMLRDVKRRFLYLGAIAFVAMVATPLLPASFQQRMGLIQGYQSDSSASSRLAVWGWTLDYVAENPFGGGFGAYRTNKLQVEVVQVRSEGGVETVATQQQVDEGRAWHSAFFEMLGEQGYPGLILYLLIHGIGLFRMEVIRRRYRNDTGEGAWIAPLATALQHFQIIYLIGALFVAIAFTPFIFLMLGAQTGFDVLIRRREQAAQGGRAWPLTGARPDPQALAPAAGA